MDTALILIISVLLLLILLFSGMWIGVAMTMHGLILISIFMGPSQLGIAPLVAWGSVDSMSLVAVPLFILMGFLLFESELSLRIYDAVAPLFEHFPGGLFVSNIGAGAIFASCTGSNLASIATIGTLSLPEIENRGYDFKMGSGSIIAGGALASLIPPSIVFIIYGSLLQISVGKLFIAGIIPGIILMFLYMTYVAIRVLIKPELVGPRRTLLPWGVCLRKLFSAWPIILLIVSVLGFIYAGVCTATEAAGMGAGGALLLTFIYRKLSWKMLQRSALGTLRITSMTMFIYIGSSIMMVPLTNLGVLAKISTTIVSLPVPPILIVIGIYCLYIILGMLVDGLAMLLLTLPTIAPIISALGYDLIWFGVISVMMVEASLLTPPVGMGLYVLQGLRPERPFKDFASGSAGFFLMILLGVGIVTAFPKLALWLPSLMLK